MPLEECETCRALRRFKGRLCKWWEFKNHKPPPALKTQNAICFTGSTLVRNVSQTVNKIHSWMLEVKVWYPLTNRDVSRCVTRSKTLPTLPCAISQVRRISDHITDGGAKSSNLGRCLALFLKYYGNNRRLVCDFATPYTTGRKMELSLSAL